MNPEVFLSKILKLWGFLQAVQQAQAAAEGWKDNIVASRAAAIDTAKAASEHAQVINFLLPLLFPSSLASNRCSEMCCVVHNCKDDTDFCALRIFMHAFWQLDRSW